MYQHDLPLVIDHRSWQETTSNFFLAPRVFLTLHLFDKYDFNINMENIQCCKYIFSLRADDRTVEFLIDSCNELVYAIIVNF